MRATAALIALLLAGCLEPSLPPDADPALTADAGPYRCTPLNCTGCCRNNICRGGNEAEACGYDGRTCQECRADTQCLTPGTCVSVARDGGPPPSSSSFGVLTDPFTGGPLMPPSQTCIFVFGRRICN